MTDKRLKVVSGVSPALAIYDYAAGDDLPLSDPYTYISRVHFHSAFKYIAFDSKTPDISTSVSITSISAYYTHLHTLGAHGKYPNIPLVFGRIYVRGFWTPLAGSVPVYYETGTSTNAVNFNLAVDDTNVYIAESRSFDGALGGSTLTFNIEVWVTREIP